MTNISGSIAKSQDYQAIVNDIAKDGRLDKKELGQFETLIGKSKLPEDQKQRLYQFAEKLSLSSNNLEQHYFLFFKISETETSKKMSPQDIKELEKLADANPIAKSLLDAFKTSQSRLNVPDTFKETTSAPSKNHLHMTHNFPFFSFSDNDSTPSQVKSQPSYSGNGSGYVAKSKLMPPENIPSFAYNQYSGLPTQGGDCGPSSALMILKANGFPADITSMRRGIGAKTSGKGPFAVDEGGIAKMIKNGSHGAIAHTADKHFKPQQMREMVNYLKNELDQGRMPILLTGTGQPPMRHYTVVTGINDDGSITIADSAAGGMNIYSPQELETRMQNSQHNGGTVIMSFQKK